MLSSVRTIGEKQKEQNWALGSSLGDEFEVFIVKVITEQLSPYFSPNVKIHPTSKSRDDGRDAVITSNVDLRGILNQNFYVEDKESIKIFIECKSTDSNSIKHERIMGNVSRIKEEKPDYFVLVTNATITPYTYYCVENELKLCGITFVLIDRKILSVALEQFGRTIGEMPKINQPCLTAEYQIMTRTESIKKAYDIYLLYHNVSENENLTTQKLLSDRNWSMEEPCVSFVIKAYGTYIKKVSIVRIFTDEIDDLLFGIKIGETETQVHIKGSDMTAFFETPLFGEGHKSCIDHFDSYFKDSESSKIHYIWGEAGVGKTRVFQEIYKRLNGQGFNFGFFVVKKNSDSFLHEIKNYLIKNYYLKKTNNYSTLAQMVKNCENSFSYGRAILFIDDCHNAPDKLWEEIKALEGCSSSVNIVLCGRTDYSVGTVAYYSFVEWCKENKSISGWNLEALSSEDTIKLVRFIITQVPQIVLEKICNMSRNNPLFIVQFIEYLLESKIVEIINRNTVGIINVSTFNLKTYIPQKVSDIYEQRLKHLTSLENGRQMHDYLLTLSVIGGRQSLSNAVRYFNEDTTLLDFLTLRRFIQIGGDGNIAFIHESMYLFFKNNIETKTDLKKHVANHIFADKPFLLDRINIHEKGRLALWNGDTLYAKECFTDYIEYLEDLPNLSAINIDIELYDYLNCIWELFHKNKIKKELLKNILKVKIYISLHHYTPAKAIVDCNEALKLIKTNKFFDGDDIEDAIIEQKAHSLINAGYLSDSELLLKKLFAKWNIFPNSMSTDITFDLFDRLCSIYKRFNCKSLSTHFNILSFREAEKKSDNGLLALAYLNKSKINFYNDYEVAYDSLLKVGEVLNDGSSKRILCSSRISLLLLDLLHGKTADLKESHEKAHSLLKQAINNNYSNSMIRSYSALAVTAFLSVGDGKSFDEAHNFIDRGIDSSIKFGIPVHIWKFYNLRAIIQSRLNQSDDIQMRTFETVHTMLKMQNLLYLGELDLCSGNILALSNIGSFYQSIKGETAFYQKMSLVSYYNSTSFCDFNCVKPACRYICSNSNRSIKKEYKKASQKELLFIDNPPKHLLRDSKTKYFIPIS
ncbi:MAG: ATP-binding protein [Chitinispirillales bacterium]|jgi:hypothetical protein|nr:ATP-binding protein [Chitinispirillales bacterium]